MIKKIQKFRNERCQTKTIGLFLVKSEVYEVMRKFVLW
jgi:hypothetical protein